MLETTDNNAGNNRQQTQETLEWIHDTINELWKSIQGNQETISEQVEGDLFEEIQRLMDGSLVIYDTTGDKPQRLTRVTNVLKYSFKLLMDQIAGKPDAEKPRNLSVYRWFIQVQLDQQQSVDDLEGLFKKFEVKNEWRITHFLPESSFGIFFRMRSWVVELVLFTLCSDKESS
jgi:hypothetical protein